MTKGTLVMDSFWERRGGPKAYYAFLIVYAKKNKKRVLWEIFHRFHTNTSLFWEGMLDEDEGYNVFQLPGV